MEGFSINCFNSGVCPHHEAVMWIQLYHHIQPFDLHPRRKINTQGSFHSTFTFTDFHNVNLDFIHRRFCLWPHPLSTWQKHQYQQMCGEMAHETVMSSEMFLISTNQKSKFRFETQEALSSLLEILLNSVKWLGSLLFLDYSVGRENMKWSFLLLRGGAALCSCQSVDLLWATCDDVWGLHYTLGPADRQADRQ